MKNSVLVIDFDGVVSPIRGRTAWGDDVVAGESLGLIVVSPTMCSELNRLADYTNVDALWLTDWSEEARARLNPIPGATWSAIANPETGHSTAMRWAGKRWDLLPWWKWWVLDEWLSIRGGITHLAWIDDHLDRRLNSAHSYDLGAAIAARGPQPMLMAPDKQVGLTPTQLGLVERHIR